MDHSIFRLDGNAVSAAQKRHQCLRLIEKLSQFGFAVWYEYRSEVMWIRIGAPVQAVLVTKLLEENAELASIEYVFDVGEAMQQQLSGRNFTHVQPKSMLVESETVFRWMTGGQRA